MLPAVSAALPQVAGGYPGPALPVLRCAVGSQMNHAEALGARTLAARREVRSENSLEVFSNPRLGGAFAVKRPGHHRSAEDRFYRSREALGLCSGRQLANVDRCLKDRYELAPRGRPLPR